VLEIATRPVPWEQHEISYALNRPPAERTPIPKVGDRVYYRRHEWDQEPTLATVLAVADLEDRSDPNLWHPVKDVTGRVIYDGDLPRMVRAPDPLPWVDLQPDDAVNNADLAKKTRCDGCDHVHEALVARTWEARVRGMPGWLPPNWRERGVKLPSQMIVNPILPAHERWLAERRRG